MLEVDLTNNTGFHVMPFVSMDEIHTNLKKECDSDAFL